MITRLRFQVQGNDRREIEAAALAYCVAYDDDADWLIETMDVSLVLVSSSTGRTLVSSWTADVVATPDPL